MSPSVIPRYSIPVLVEEKNAHNVKLSLAAVSVTCVSYGTSSDIFLSVSIVTVCLFTSNDVLVGMQLLLCIHCMRRLWARQPRTTFTYFLLSYTAFLGIVNTFWMATAPASLQLYIMEWLQDCRPVSGAIPGPPSCPEDWQSTYEWDTWMVDTLSVVSYVTGSVACDALLVRAIIGRVALSLTVW